MRRENARGLEDPETVMPVVDRPRIRADCIDGPRPCPWASCAHHNGFEVTELGHLKRNFGSLPIWEMMTPTCSLDVADKGGTTLDEVGLATGKTRERIRQVEERAMIRAKRNAERLGIEIEFPKDRRSNHD